MSTSGLSVDELFGTDAEVEGQETTESLAVEDALTFDPELSGPCCEKCSAPIRGGQVDVCSQCGWYASLGTFVEVDQNWEPEDDDPNAASDAAAPSHLQVWINLLPWYAWLTIAGVAVILATSVAVRLVLADSALRTTWSLTQLAVGAGVFCFCHVVLFLYLAMDNSETGVFDIVASPFKAWVHSARRLPRRLSVFDAGVWGVTSAVTAMAIVGGIPYERLLDWGFKERPKGNLLGAVLDQAKKTKGKDMSLEEAIEELSGKASVEDLTEAEDTKPEPKMRQNIDCVILGFRADDNGLVHTLILGAAHNGRLHYAGRVTPELKEKEHQQLYELLTNSKIPQPFLPIKLSATWVRPRYTCRVSYTERAQDGRIFEIEWQKLLSHIKISKKR